MHPRTILLGLVAAVVAVGGIFLLLEVRASGASADDVGGSEPRPAASVHHPELPARAPSPSKGSPAIPRPHMVPHLSPDRRPDVARAAVVDMASRVRAAEEAKKGQLDLDGAMLEANKAYDRHDYDSARSQALKLLERSPGNVRMLRVVVSSSCIMGDADVAQSYWRQLPEFDRKQMATRCERYEVRFTP